MAETETETDRCVRDRETGRDGAAQGSEVGTEVLARVPVPASQAPGQGMPRGACLPVQLALPESQAQGACGFAEGWAWGTVWVEEQVNCWSTLCTQVLGRKVADGRMDSWACPRPADGDRDDDQGQHPVPSIRLCMSKVVGMGPHCLHPHLLIIYRHTHPVPRALRGECSKPSQTQSQATSLTGGEAKAQEGQGFPQGPTQDTSQGSLRFGSWRLSSTAMDAGDTFK